MKTVIELNEENQMDDLMQMAREAGIDDWWDSGSDWRETFDAHLERFAQLVAKQAVEPLLQAAIQTLEENGHLADGDNCTLLVLKNAVSKYTSLGCSSKETL